MKLIILMTILLSGCATSYVMPCEWTWIPGADGEVAYADCVVK